MANSLLPDPNSNKRMLLVLLLSATIFLGFDFIGREFFGVGFTGPVEKPAVTAEAAPAATQTVAPGVTPTASIRVPLANADVAGQVALTGGRLDSLTLKHFAETQGEAAGYTLFAPEGEHAEYLAAGWLGSGIEGPGEATGWQLEGDQQTENAVTMVWRNATGQAFQRVIAFNPQGYVATITERVMNGAELPVTLTPYAQLHRAGGTRKGETSSWVNYFGPMGVVGDVTHEAKYADIKDEGKTQPVIGSGGWWGISSQYFLAAIMPGEQLGETTRQFSHAKVNGQDFTTASVQGKPTVVPAGGSVEVSYQVYLGPKQDSLLTAAGHSLERAIDWGWFKVIARPLHKGMLWLHDHLWNSWALAVVALTLLLKIVTFPLANKSYHAMAKMKKLQPRIEELRKRHEGDQQAMALATMDLYRSQKVNPVSGCWPVVIQIPIFFAMYKAILVAFEFRHAPLGGWIHDMSAADPLYVLPVLMGLSMFVQFKLNPAPTDPVQASMFKWMPVFMTVMFLWFPSGLVMYWFVNNVFSIAQQAFIMRKDKAL